MWHCAFVPPVTACAAGELSCLPATEGGDELYDDFAAAHGRRHASAAEYEHRRTVFHSNRLLVEAHNAANSHNYSLALNRFADWSQVCPAFLPEQTILSKARLLMSIKVPRHPFHLTLQEQDGNC